MTGEKTIKLENKRTLREVIKSADGTTGIYRSYLFYDDGSWEENYNPYTPHTNAMGLNMRDIWDLIDYYMYAQDINIDKAISLFFRDLEKAIAHKFSK